MRSPLPPYRAPHPPAPRPRPPSTLLRVLHHLGVLALSYVAAVALVLGLLVPLGVLAFLLELADALL